MKKYYLLSSRIPADSKKKWPADIQVKLDAYKKDQYDHKNEPPHIRPYPLEKYAVNKETTIKNVKGADDEEEEEEEVTLDDTIPFASSVKRRKVAVGTVDKALFEGMPPYAIKRARELLPHLRRLELDTMSTPRFRDLLLDLTSNKLKVLTQPPSLLLSVIRQLDADPHVSSRLYKRKVGAAVGEISMSAAHPRQPPRSHSSDRPSTSTPKHYSTRKEYISKPVWK